MSNVDADKFIEKVLELERESLKKINKTEDIKMIALIKGLYEKWEENDQNDNY